MSTLTGINSESQFNKFAIKDLFIGFKYEILQSLIMNIIKNNPEADNNRVLETCKECLIATVSSDGIVRAERSALERDEVDRWKHVYFHQQHHESLYDYFANQENLLSDLNGNLVIIYTFSNIDTDVRSCLQELMNQQLMLKKLFSSTSKIQPHTPSGYYLQSSMYLDHVHYENIINFDWNNGILSHSQRNLAVARGQDIVYDLTKIEEELANILAFEKVYIETQPDSQLYLEPFPYHMELFQGYNRIFNDVDNLITQEPIPIEKMNLLKFSKIQRPCQKIT
ncbi:hypothetical protein RhiirA4_444522 [Rhizophagus irregularis]|uniref:Uncharacterized protein n=1 Tax=Rhizophagus irregularis TaxID=588596 RepID=A0A2I1GJL4_9GLOM|nr:hypothetical protein RhiirA4_444522 [Rhizophagus irregularis]